MTWTSGHVVAAHFPRASVTAAEFREYIAKKWSLRLRLGRRVPPAPLTRRSDAEYGALWLWIDDASLGSIPREALADFFGVELVPGDVLVGAVRHMQSGTVLQGSSTRLINENSTSNAERQTRQDALMATNSARTALAVAALSAEQICQKYSHAPARTASPLPGCRRTLQRRAPASTTRSSSSAPAATAASASPVSAMHAFLCVTVTSVPRHAARRAEH